MKLNLGSGKTPREGWVNVDLTPACNPDVVWNLEQTPWPWPSNSVDEVLLSHVLEHLGADPNVYIAIVKELYRVCQDGARITIVVPHPRHDYFLFDPTHVRPITPNGLEMFSQRENLRAIGMHAANTPLGIYSEVDFEITSVEPVYAERWMKAYKAGKINGEGLVKAAKDFNNVIEQYTIVWKPLKPSTLQRQKMVEALSPVRA